VPGRHAVSRTGPRAIAVAVLAVLAVLGTGAAIVWGASGGWPARDAAAGGSAASGGVAAGRNRSVDGSAAPQTTAPAVADAQGGADDGRGADTRAGRRELRPADKPGRRPSSSPTAAGTAAKGTCGASYYDTGRVTANGERFNPDGITAAHRTLPFNTRVRVTNRANGKTVVVRINDRGPFVGGRCLDLSRGAFVAISSLSAGVATVDYEVLA
jgi:rare lipoprotein A